MSRALGTASTEAPRSLQMDSSSGTLPNETMHSLKCSQRSGRLPRGQHSKRETDSEPDALDSGDLDGGRVCLVTRCARRPWDVARVSLATHSRDQCIASAFECQSRKTGCAQKPDSAGHRAQPESN